MPLVVAEDGVYRPFNYRGLEKEFEKQMIIHSKQIFGEDAIYFSVKKKIKSKKTKIGTIPDGYLIDLSNAENPVLYIVEVELSGHDTLQHIATQVLGFELTFPDDKFRIHQILSEEVNKDEEKAKFLKEKIAGSYRTIEHFVSELVFNRDHKVMVVIDKVDESLKRLPDLVRVPITILKFQTFVRDMKEGLKGKTIHEFTPLYEEGEIPTKEVSTWYKFVCGVIDQPNTPREEFDSKFGLSKYTQGYTYTKDDKGNIEGIAFLWYRSHIDNHMEKDLKDGITYVATSRPINVGNLKKGMHVYLVETSYDRTAGEKVENPKVRLRGRLIEVYRVDGTKETKIFPLE